MKSTFKACLIFSVLSTSTVRAQGQPQSVETGEQQLFKVQGFLWTSFTYASQALSSFASKNLVAPTAARIRVEDTDERSRSSLQVAQSRLSLGILPQAKASGRLEVDFVDFAKASPTTTSVPRLRIAKIDYRMSEKLKLFAGQDWDVFSPLNPYTFNYVGSYFNAGNTGFMRQQAGVIFQSGVHESAVALGLPGANGTPSDSNVELNHTPTLALRYAVKSDSFKGGVSLIAGRVIFNNDRRAHANVGGATLFSECQVHTKLSLRTELYAGQNLASLGTLAIAAGRPNEKIREVGGFLSARQRLGETWALFGGVGIAAILDQEKVLLPSDTVTGMRENQNFRLGYEKAFAENLNHFTEIALYRTHYQGESKHTSAHSVSSGLQLTF